MSIHKNVHYIFDRETIALPRFDTLVIGGGGFKGCLFLGGLAYLEELDALTSVRTYCGTSVGAIVCLLSVMGYTARQQLEMLPISNVYKFQKQAPYLINAVPDAIREIVDETKTFQQLFDESGKHLFVVAFDMTASREKIFSVLTSPDVSVAQALIYSCALPSLNMPCDEQGHRFIDGGVVNNLPVDIADRFDLSEHILTLNIGMSDQEQQTRTVINDLMNAMVSVPSSLLDEYRLASCRKPVHLMTFKCDRGLEQLISVTETNKRDMFAMGYNTARDEIKKFHVK